IGDTLTKENLDKKLQDEIDKFDRYEVSLFSDIKSNEKFEPIDAGNKFGEDIPNVIKHGVSQLSDIKSNEKFDATAETGNKFGKGTIKSNEESKNEKFGRSDNIPNIIKHEVSLFSDIKSNKMFQPNKFGRGIEFHK